ncbi:MAG: hypothetical protein Hyperionvirus9_80 [Hyperionvirus sp.]|uniref:valine--tRNA ligase n=1 Tax=Hyperionvirus sp. TaxID=2487770 RepID=A0A3G5ACQ2_9VIRU|nr:MAG: hypothetical protein Hyperionvirus9_80 [Hyperionvirus sp.]
MAKTLGNVIDPNDIIKLHGTDALRFTLVFMSSATKDIKIDTNSFKIGRALVTKLWNAARFITMKTIKTTPPIATDESKIIELKLAHTKVLCKKLIEQYDFNGYARTIYSFFFDEFCSVYLEKTKNDHSVETFKALYETFMGIIKLFHPVIPFVTEKIYQKFKADDSKYPFKHSIMIEDF